MSAAERRRLAREHGPPGDAPPDVPPPPAAAAACFSHWRRTPKALDIFRSERKRERELLGQPHPDPCSKETWVKLKQDWQPLFSDLISLIFIRFLR